MRERVSCARFYAIKPYNLRHREHGVGRTFLHIRDPRAQRLPGKGAVAEDDHPGAAILRAAHGAADALRARSRILVLEITRAKALSPLRRRLNEQQGRGSVMGYRV